MVADTCFPRFSLSLKACILSWAINQLLSLKWQAHFTDLAGNICQIPSLKTHSFVCQFLFQVKPWQCLRRKRRAQLTTQAHTCFSLNNYCTSGFSERAFCAFPISSARMFKRHILESWDLIALYTFHCSVRDIYKWHWLFLFCPCMTSSTFIPLPWFVLKHQ